MTTPSTTLHSSMTSHTASTSSASARRETFASRMRPADQERARLAMTRLVCETSEDAISKRLWSCIEELAPFAMEGRVHMPRMCIAGQFSMKDLCVRDGKAFQNTGAQRALTALYRLAGTSSYNGSVEPLDLIILRSCIKSEPRHLYNRLGDGCCVM